MCLDVDKSLSVGNQATPLCFFIPQSAEKQSKEQKARYS
jgi:hypothetical protein